MTCKTECSFSKITPSLLWQIDNIQEDFVRLSGYASQLSDIEPSKLCHPKAAKRIKDVQRFLMFIENQFYELRSMLDIDGDIHSEIDEFDENTFNLSRDFSNDKNDSPEQILASELTDSILKILTGTGKNCHNPDLTSRLIMIRKVIDHSMKKAALELDKRVD
jgi:hypothetical protein